MKVAHLLVSQGSFSEKYRHMGLAYDPTEWRQMPQDRQYFISACWIFSLNVINLWNCACFAWISLQYTRHQWSICSDLKVVALLLGMQGVYTKNLCFLCLWDMWCHTGVVQTQWMKKRKITWPRTCIFNVRTVSWCQPVQPLVEGSGSAVDAKRLYTEHRRAGD